MSLDDYGIVIDSRPNQYIHEDDYLTYEQIQAREEKRAVLKADHAKQQIFSGSLGVVEVKFDGQNIGHTVAGTFITEEPGHVLYNQNDQVIDRYQEVPACQAYAKPKQVKALWLGQTEGDVEIAKHEQLLNQACVGFVTEHGDKMFILMRGSDRGIIVGRNVHQYSTVDKCRNERGIYYIFPTARDLYLWMAEGEE